MEAFHVECACRSPEHTIKFFVIDDDNSNGIDAEISMNIFLSEFGVFTRLYRGIKYIFGYKCKYGHFDEVLIDKATANEIIKIMKKIAWHYWLSVI